MTPAWRHASVAAASALATAALLAGGLLVQHTRNAWPFAHRAGQASGPRPVSTPGTEADRLERVPIEVVPSALQNLGVHVEEVRRQSLTRIVHAVATVVPDESRISHVHTRVAGWVEELLVNTTGEMVHAGQPLAHLFSQELLSSQIEYLAARRSTAASGIASAVIASGRTRLTVLGMTPSEIDAIEQAGEPRRLVTVVAPRDGVVVNRGVTVGAAVEPSTTLLTIADLSRVWVFAEVPEADISAVRVGSRAQLDIPASGRTPFDARVDFLYPTLTERTRTLRVRFSVANPRGALRPGLYGTAAFESAGVPTLTVPRDAVVDTGRQQHVFVVVGDRFEPRPVTLGLLLADRVEVRTGLEEGERIVSAGVFLLDSESRLRATGGAGGHDHGMPTAPDVATPHDAHQSEAPSDDPHAGHRE